MGFFDELGKALKKAGDDMKKSGPEHGKDAGQGPGPAGRDSAPSARSPHPGYRKIAAWMKRNYEGRIASASRDRYQQGIELEQLAAEACRGLSAKAKKGFMDYLKQQDYEPLLR